jgi:hypothetical protein
MELFLNLLWLMLVIPAAWLCAHRVGSVHSARAADRLRALVLLGCVLALLFPVVSATDDLHAMRPEAEECGSNKRAEKHFAGAKAHPSVGTVELFAGTTQIAPSLPDNECGRVLIPRGVIPAAVSLIIRAGRAPPSSII